MYLPQAFAQSDVAELQAFIETYPFGTLVVPRGDAPPEVSHLPFLVRRSGERGALVSHVARANPIWQAFDARTPALAIFHGPHGYISPAWYTSRNEVPTWTTA
jgi:transcriptional regulator